MSKLKTISILLSFLILINHCGYSTVCKKKRFDFSIQINNLTGDRDFNNSLKSELNRYFNIEKLK